MGLGSPQSRIACLVVATLVLAAAPAQARFVDVHAGLRAGGLTGSGAKSAERSDFFELVRGPAAGFELGVKLLVLDLSVSFMQVLGGKGQIGDPGQRLDDTPAGQIGDPGENVSGDGPGTGTLTQFLLGFEMEFDLAPRLVLRPRISAGFALGTEHPVTPPLHNDDVSHKGVVAQGEVALEKYLNPFLSVGAQLDLGVHYLLGGTLVVNDSRNWSSGVQLLGMLTATAHLGL